MKFMKKIHDRLVEKKNDKFDFKKNNQMNECKKIEHPFDGGRPTNLGQADIKDGETFDVMEKQKNVDTSSHAQKSKKGDEIPAADADADDDDGKGDIDEPRRRPYVIVDNFMEYEEYL